MITALLLALTLSFQAPDEGVDPKQIEAAVTELTAAFGKDGTPQRRVEAIKSGALVLDARVIEWIKKGLADKEAGVVTAAVDALGRMQHPDALDALHSYCKKEKRKLVDDEVLFAQVLQAIGRHGSPSSIDLLADDPFSPRVYTTVQARVMALGNIRDVKAVEELISLSKLVGPRRMDGARGDFRLALARLTGRDLGADPIGWQSWWQKNKKGFEVAKEAPELEAGLQRQWNRYWGIDQGKQGDAGTDGKRGRRRDGGGDGGGGGTGGTGGRGG